MNEKEEAIKRRET